MSIDIISIILTRDHRSDPSRPWLQTSTAFMPTHSTISFHHSSPVIVDFRTNRRFVCTKLHSIALNWNSEMDTVFSCCWVHMPVYDSVSLERSYMSLMKMEMKMILMQSLTVGSKLHSLWNDTPVNSSSLV